MILKLVCYNRNFRSVRMKETTFINQNKKKWAKFERMSLKGENDPDEISELFVELTDDLAYARTHYPKRSVRVYLNSLAQKSFHNIYKKKREPFSKLIHFWTTGLPLEMYRARKALLASFLVFFIGMIIGIVSTNDDHDFLGAVVGYHYVDVTEANIENGKPMDIYGSGGEITSFISIAMNNLRVALYTFVLGLFFSLGSAFFIFFNGIMVGAFQWFFKVRGLLLTSFLTIWIHGAFEISSIILAGAAGMTMGNSLMFPKTLTRSQSLVLGAKRGMKIMIGIMPVIVLAAFIEGFATRHTEWPEALKWFIILGSFGIMVTYFVIYPQILARKYNFSGKIVEKPSYVPKKEFHLYRIREVGSVFTDTYVFFNKAFKIFGKIYWFTIPVSILFVITLFTSIHGGSTINDWWDNIYEALGIGRLSFRWETFAVNTWLFSITIAAVYYAFTKLNQQNVTMDKKFIRFVLINHLRVIPVTAMILAAFEHLPMAFNLLLLFVLPFVLSVSIPGAIENKKLFTGIRRGFMIGQKSWGNGLATTAIFLFVNGLIFFFALIPVHYILKEVVDWFTILSDNYYLYNNIIEACLYVAFLHFLVPFFFIAYGLIYFSTVEKEEGFELFEKLKKFGKHSRVYEDPEDGDF